MKKLMIFGCGYSGLAIAKEFMADGYQVMGTTRTQENIAHLKAAHIEGLLFDGQAMNPAFLKKLKTATHLIQSIAPDGEGDAVAGIIGEDIKELMPDLQWICYLSTIGVYGDHQGAWVTEETEINPQSDRSTSREFAEEQWQDIAEEAEIPLSILRLAGIYGPDRNAFLTLKSGQARRVIKKDQVFNRIRVEDIAGAAKFLSDRNENGVFNIADNEPCPAQDVLTEAARLMDVTPPPEEPFETAELSPMARSFYEENKRASNAKIRELGFNLKFPEYRMSLAQLWQDHKAAAAKS